MCTVQTLPFMFEKCPIMNENDTSYENKRHDDANPYNPNRNASVSSIDHSFSVLQQKL